MREKGKTLQIGLLLNLNNKADRDRLSGALRFSASVKDWKVWILDGSSDDFDRTCRIHLRGNALNGLVFSEQKLFARIRRLGVLSKDIRLAAIDIDRATTPPADITIRLDAVEIARTAVNLLSTRGFRHLAYFGTDAASERTHSTSWEGSFAQIAKQKGNYCGSFRMMSAHDWSSSLEAAAEWIRSLPKPCGFMAYSDALARDLLDACRLARIQCPQQIAIIGVDNAVDICETAVPPLSSILPNFELSGFLAAQHLNQILRKRPAKKNPDLFYGIRLLVERASTQDLRGCGHTVTAGLGIIRREAGKHLTVAELARQLHMSERLLSMHFNAVLGHGAHREIENARIALLERSLRTERFRTLGEIALACGYRTVGAAQTAFRKRHKTSMSDYRTAR